MKQTCTNLYLHPRGPTQQILMTGGGGWGGPTEVRILYPQKLTTSEFVYPKNHYFSYNTQKNPLVPFSQPKQTPLFVFATQKNPSVFHRPKKTHFGQNFRPKKITRTLPSLKYVSRAPGTCTTLNT